jgi:hypothetical protein
MRPRLFCDLLSRALIGACDLELFPPCNISNVANGNPNRGRSQRRCRYNFDPKDANALLKAEERFKGLTGAGFTAAVRTASGEPAVTHFENCVPVSRYGVALDITDSKRIEETLERALTLEPASWRKPTGSCARRAPKWLSVNASGNRLI